MISLIKKEIFINDAFETFYLKLYGAEHTVTEHSDSENGNLLPLLHGILFLLVKIYAG